MTKKSPPQNVSQRRDPEREGTTPAETGRQESEVLTFEADAWRGVLGKDVEVASLPSMVTPEVRKNLERLGFELRFIPKLDIGTIDDLKKKGEERYLDELQERYPGWRRYGSLNGSERRDHSVGRNLDEWYWGLVKTENIDFPRLPGVWVAVETMPKPYDREFYEKTPVTDRLGLSDRFDVSWDDAQAAIQKVKREILSEAGLPSDLDVRMLEVYEWNLLANREGWGKTKSYEWTNTEYIESGFSVRIGVGYSGGGGAAFVNWENPRYGRDDFGFRLAIVLGS